MYVNYVVSNKWVGALYTCTNVITIAVLYVYYVQFFIVYHSGCFVCSSCTHVAYILCIVILWHKIESSNSVLLTLAVRDKNIWRWSKSGLVHVYRYIYMLVQPSLH